MKYELYLITNEITHKKYVGQTSSEIGYKRRFDIHCSTAMYKYRKDNSILHASIRKYGKESFSVKRLLKDIDEDKIDFYEQLWIMKLDTFYRGGNGYNMTLGGQGIHGYHHTEETKKKVSEMFRGRSVPEDVIQKRKDTTSKNKSLEKRSKNPLWKQHISEGAKKRFETEPSTFKGRKHTQEAKDTIAMKNGKPVAMIDIDSGCIVCVFKSAADATRYLIECGKTTNKNAFSRILKICHGQDKTAYGYMWKFIEKV